MTSKIAAGDPADGLLRALRAAALIAVLAGAAGSVGLMVHASGRTASRLGMAVIALWVISPFIALVVAGAASKSWPVLTGTTLQIAMLVNTLGSLAVYVDDALKPRHAQAAFVFVVVPPASWLLIATAVVISARISGRRSRRRDGS